MNNWDKWNKLQPVGFPNPLTHLCVEASLLAESQHFLCPSPYALPLLTPLVWASRHGKGCSKVWISELIYLSGQAKLWAKQQRTNLDREPKMFAQQHSQLYTHDSFSPHHCDKIPHKEQYKEKEGGFGLWFEEVQSIMAGKPWQQEHEAAC